ncbi:MAG: tryptophan 7-halogenase [Tsuneonella sp.]
MSEPREPLRRIVVAGGGQLGVLAAIGLKRALPRCEVVVIGLRPDRAAFADFAATSLPFTGRLHERLGVDEMQIVQAAGGSHRLVMRYFGWGGADFAGTMAFGADIDPALRTGFARDWGGGPRNASGKRAVGSLAEVLADAGKFAVPREGEPDPFPEVDYALRWNPAAYRDLLVSIAQRAGVIHVGGDVAGIELDGAGGVAALSIAGGEPIAADLFVDCSGPKAQLLSRLADWKTVDWGGTLPVREVTVAVPGSPMLSLEDRTILLAHGWRSELAGRDGLQVTFALAPDTTAEAALRALGAQPLVTLPVAPGRVTAPWIGNVVALGDAAARFEPLGFLNLDLAHRQLDLLLEMLPGRDIQPLERAEYNRRSGLMMDAVRDTLTAHYAAPAALQVFGKHIETSKVLDQALDQFTRRGRMPFREEAPFHAAEFQALLAALGFPAGISPQARAQGPAAEDDAREKFAARANSALAQAPSYADWMGAMLRSGPAHPG